MVWACAEEDRKLEMELPGRRERERPQRKCNEEGREEG